MLSFSENGRGDIEDCKRPIPLILCSSTEFWNSCDAAISFSVKTKSNLLNTVFLKFDRNRNFLFAKFAGRASAKILKSLKIQHEIKIVSAHRTPKRMYDFAKNAKKNKISVIIAGAGGSAHLPGMIASLTSIPVIGVPIESKKLKGLDSLLSIAQMPKGIPVGSLAIGKDGAINAGLLAASIIANSSPTVKKKLNSWRLSQTKSIKKNPK